MPLTSETGANSQYSSQLPVNPSANATMPVGSNSRIMPNMCRKGNSIWAPTLPCGDENGRDMDGTGYMNTQETTSAKPSPQNPRHRLMQPKTSPMTSPSVLRQSPVIA